MVSVRKRKMARSTIKKATRRTKDKQRDINIASNPIIAAKWDKSLTLKQNYKKLGLRSNLGKAAGGEERTLAVDLPKTSGSQDGMSISEIESTEDPSQIPQGEARIIRDGEGNVLKVIHGTKEVSDNKNGEQDAESEVISALKAKALKHASIKRERNQSDRESEWCEKLYNKYGDNFEKMVWDKKLNIWQQSVGDLKRRILKWKKNNNIE